jgi:hypothetical protein
MMFTFSWQSMFDGLFEAQPYSRICCFFTHSEHGMYLSLSVSKSEPRDLPNMRRNQNSCLMFAADKLHSIVTRWIIATSFQGSSIIHSSWLKTPMKQIESMMNFIYLDILLVNLGIFMLV